MCSAAELAECCSCTVAANTPVCVIFASAFHWPGTQVLTLVNHHCRVVKHASDAKACGNVAIQQAPAAAVKVLQGKGGSHCRVGARILPGS